MFSLTIPELSVGMVVITPTTLVPYLTEDKKYVVLSIDGDEWIQIQDDTGMTRHYQSHLFIEANVYYSMVLWLSLMRMFDISPKDM
jgi:hypothetical protein